MAFRAARGARSALRYSASKPSPCLEARCRNFTSSRTRQKSTSVPTFKDASNSELQELLSTIRSNLILPAYLSDAERSVVYSPKSKRSLEDDPRDIEISGEKFPLRFLDVTKDLPAGPLPKRVIDLMKTKEDWDNLPSLLEGLKTARENKGLRMESGYIREQSALQIMRRASLADRQDVVIECARRVSDTDFSLTNFKVVCEMMWWIQYRALSHDWDPSQTRKAFGMAQQLARLLEDERHCGRGSISGPNDPRVRPEVIGVLLELSSALAKTSGTKEDKLNVEIYTKRLLGVMSDGVELWSWVDAKNPREREVHVAGHRLRNYSPLLYGMREASAVLGPSSAEAKLLNKKIDELTKRVKAAADIVMRETGEAPKLGRWTYEKLFPAGI